VTAEAFLSSIIEVAIGIAGFAGIIAAIRQGNITNWPPLPRIRLDMLLVGSASAIVFGLLPAVLTEAQVPQRIIWSAGSSGILAWMMILMVIRTIQFRKGDFEYRTPTILAAWFLSIAVLQGLNIVLSLSWLYLLGVSMFLVNSFVFFWQLLFDDVSERDSAD
jgi:hypothetical protein